MEKNKRKNICFYLIFCMFSLTLLSCAGKESATNKQEFLDPNETIYIGTYPNLPFGISAVSINNNQILGVSVGNEVYRFDTADFEKWEKIPCEIPDGTNSIENIQLDYDENFYLITTAYEPDLESEALILHSSLLKYDSQGTLLATVDLSDLQKDSLIRATSVDQEGNLFLLFGQQSLYVYENQSRELRPIHIDDGMYVEGISNTPDGTVYACLSSFSINSHCNQICTVSASEGLSTALYDNFCTGNGFSTFEGDGFLTSFGNSLYLYDSETNENSLLVNWTNVGIDSSEVKSFFSFGDSKVLVFCDSYDKETGEIAILSTISRLEYREKQTISIGTLQSSNSLNHAVSQFNRKNSSYRIEVKEYYDYLLDESYLDDGRRNALQSFHMDIVSGKCPDIMHLSREDLQQYADKGLFLDLSAYLDEQSGLTFSDTIRQAYTLQNKLVALPANIQLRTISGRINENDVGDSWTLEEMMKYIDEHPSLQVFSASPSTLLEYCFTCYMDSFVDFENKTCDFCRQEFFELLEFCKKYGQKNAERYSLIYSPWFQKDSLLHEITIREPDAISFLKQEYQGKEYSFIGFPTRDNQCGTILEEAGGCFSIYSQSSCPDGAWEFLSFLFTDVQKPSIYNFMVGFPAVQESLDAYFHYIDEQSKETDKRQIYYTDIDGLVHYVPSTSEIDALKELIRSADFPDCFDTNIMQMIQEEAEYYFDADKSAETVAELIQSRVSLYLSE